jgi:hypothetical protein
MGDPVSTQTLSDLVTGKKSRPWGQGALTAVNKALIGTPMFPWELSKKAVSMIPGLPSYEFGSDTEHAYDLARKYHILNDQGMAPATGWQKTFEDTVGAATSGGTFGTMARLPQLINAAKTSVPALNNVIRQIGTYDVGLPASVEPFASGLDQGNNSGAATAARVVLPILGGHMMPRGDVGVKEGALRSVQNRLGTATGFRSSPGQEGLRMPLQDMAPPSGNTLRSTANDAYRNAGATKAMLASPTGARTALENRAANVRTVEGMPVEGVNLQQVSTDATSVARSAAEDLLSRLPGSGSGFRNMADRIMDLMFTERQLKNDLYANLGDATKLGAVDATPLHKAWQDILRDKKASAALNGGLGETFKSIRAEMDRVLGANLDATAAAQQGANDAVNAQLLAKYQQDVAHARSMRIPEPPMPPELTAPSVGAVNVPNRIAVGDLMEQSKYLNSMYESLTPTGRWLLGKLQKAIDDTIEQNPYVKQQLDVAKEQNIVWRTLSDPSSPYGKAMEIRDADKARQFLTDHIKKVFTGQNQGEHADELADLFSRNSSPDELRTLFTDALGDAIADKAWKAGAKPEEVVRNVAAARAEVTAATRFAERIGIPRNDIDQIASTITRDVEAASPRVQELTKLKDNPSAYIKRAVTGTPEEQALVRSTLDDVSQVNPNAGAVIEGNLAQTEAARRALAESDVNLTRAAADQKLNLDFSNGELANVGALGGAAAGVNPFLMGRATRLGEHIADFVRHNPARENLYGEYLANPSKYYGDLMANPFAHSGSSSQRMLPTIVNSIDQVYTTRRQEPKEPSAEATSPVVDDWVLPSEEELLAAPVGPTGKNKDEDWSFEADDQSEKPLSLTIGTGR